MDAPTQVIADLPAPSALVLSVIADLAAYPTWVAGTTEVEVLEADEAGHPLLARFAVGSGPVRGRWTLAYDWKTTPVGTGAVSWSLVSGDVLRRLDGSHTLRAVGEQTRLVHRLRVETKLPVAGPLRRRAERAVVERVVADLRARVAQVDRAS